MWFLYLLITLLKPLLLKSQTSLLLNLMTPFVILILEPFDTVGNRLLFKVFFSLALHKTTFSRFFSFSVSFDGYFYYGHSLNMSAHSSGFCSKLFSYCSICSPWVFSTQMASITTHTLMTLKLISSSQILYITLTYIQQLCK